MVAEMMRLAGGFVSPKIFTSKVSMGGATEHVRLLRSYLPDGTRITTSMEEHELRLEAQEIAEEERRREAEAELERLRAQLANRQDESG